MTGVLAGAGMLLNSLVAGAGNYAVSNFWTCQNNRITLAAKQKKQNCKLRPKQLCTVISEKNTYLFFASFGMI